MNKTFEFVIEISISSVLFAALETRETAARNPATHRKCSSHLGRSTLGAGNDGSGLSQEAVKDIDIDLVYDLDLVIQK